MLIDAQRRRFNRAKRIIDVFLIGLASPALLVAGVATGIATRLAQGRPLVFKQQRIGLKCKPFELIKFRTMTDARDGSGNLLPDAQRLTSVGRVLRKTSLDELPQIINVIRGDMSLIGPRPLLVEYMPYYRDYEQRRHTVRPGVTGLAQVSGRNGLLWDERLKLDVKYASDARLKNDISILLRTVEQVCRGNDVTIVAGDSGERLDVVRTYPSARGYALRRLEFVDIPTRVEWFNDSKTRQHMQLPEGVTLESTTHWLRAARRKGKRHDFVVYDTKTGTLMAMLGVQQTEQQRLPELYILVAPGRTGQGIGSLSLAMLVEWLRNRSEFEGCSLKVGKDNAAALALYEKFGFTVSREIQTDNRIAMELNWEGLAQCSGQP